MGILHKINRHASQLRYLHLWIALALSLIFGIVFAILAHRNYQSLHEELDHDVVVAQTEILNRFQDTVEYLGLLGDELLNEKLAESNFQTRAANFTSHHREITSLGWLDDQTGSNWFAPAGSGNISTILPRQELAAAAARARQRRSFVISQVFRTFNGEASIAVFVPITSDTEHIGLFYCVFSLSRMIDLTVPSWLNDRYDVGFVDSSGHIISREASRQRLDFNLVATSEPIAPGLELYIRLQRYKEGHDWQNILLMALSLGVIFGVAMAVRGLNVDRGHKRQLALQMQAARDLAELANRTKSEFVANVSHELRTPLTAIVGYSDLLLRGLPTPPELPSYLNAISRNAQNLLLLINDLLDHSKMEAGFLEVSREPLHLPDFLAELLLSCALLAQNKGIQLQMGTRGAVPLSISSDGLRLKQILINVISNAIKFTERGTVKVMLSCRASTDPRELDQLDFMVEDQGIGIAEAQQQLIFESFAQAHPKISQQFGGTGLGLSLSRKLARLLGGDLVLLKSVPNLGSTFSVRIPIKIPNPAVAADWFEMPQLEAPPQSVQLTLDDLPALPGRRILLVEDSYDNQLLVSEYLRRCGATVAIVGDGESALASLHESSSFDLILMDVQLPGMDGYATSQEIRRLGFSLPIVTLTAHTSQGEEQRCLAAGCQAYLAKPFDPARLVETVQRLCFNAPTPVPASASASFDGERPLYSRLVTDSQLRGILLGFVSRIPARLEAIDSARQRGDWPALAHLAHTFKGTAANFGFPELSETAAALEESSLAPNPAAAVSPLCQKLQVILSQIRRGLEEADRG